MAEFSEACVTCFMDELVPSNNLMICVILLDGTGTGTGTGTGRSSGDVGICVNVQWCVCSNMTVIQQVATPGDQVLYMLLSLKYLSRDMDIRCWCVMK